MRKPSRLFRDWTRRSHSKTAEIARCMFSAIGSPFALSQLEALRKGDFLSIVSAKVDPSTYTDHCEFRDDYLAAELFSKYPDWKLGVDRAAVAITKFIEAEEQCAETNLRLLRSYGTSSTEVSCASLLYTARRKIARLLGPFSWDQAERYFGFGPGATYTLPRSQGHSYYKFRQQKPETTKANLALAYTCISRVPRWFKRLTGYSCENPLTVRDLAAYADEFFTIVPGNKVITVPKNAKTDRVIAIEPLMNMFVQKGIGGLIRRRLKRVGVNLDSQTRNQRLARYGSKTGRLATIDLKSASDSVSIELVRALLPPDWFEAIEHCRSPVGVLPSGELITYQKVSSMGNGFTFELESLIFWALCASVYSFHGRKERRIAVYGDDLVVFSDLYKPVVDLLSFCGFTTNETKSFAHGPFRESCGKHYFQGYDVTPFYIRRDVASAEQLVLVANNLRRHARNRYPWGLDGRFFPVWCKVAGWLPPPLQQPLIPDGFGDGALIGDKDEVVPRRHRYFDAYYCRMVVVETPTFRADDDAVALRILFQTEGYMAKGPNPCTWSGDTPVRGDCIPRYRVSAPRIKTVVVSQWPSYGSWV